MQELTIKIDLLYRSDVELTKKAKKLLLERVQDYIRQTDKEELFKTNATYAGYNCIYPGMENMDET